MQRVVFTSRRNRIDRSGASTMVVLITLVVFSILIGASTKWVFQLGGQLRKEEHRAQVEFLVQSGISKAKTSLNANPDYTGEKWEISEAELGTDEKALVQIELSHQSPTNDLKTVIIRATYPSDSLKHVQKTVQFEYQRSKDLVDLIGLPNKDTTNEGISNVDSTK